MCLTMDKIYEQNLSIISHWYECMSIGVPDHDTCVGKTK